MTNFFHRQINFEQWKPNFDGSECSYYLKLKTNLLKICDLGIYFLCDMMRRVRRTTVNSRLTKIIRSGITFVSQDLC